LEVFWWEDAGTKYQSAGNTSFSGIFPGKSGRKINAINSGKKPNKNLF